MTAKIKPKLEAKVNGSGAVGETLSVVARLLPAGAGKIRIRVWRGARLVATGRGRACG